MNSDAIQGNSVDAKPLRKRSRGYNNVDILIFFIPCLRVFQVRLIGTLSGSDLLFLAVFLVLAIRGRIRIGSPAGKKFMLLCSLWLVSQCVTDIVRHSAFADYMRGWSNIGLTLVNFAVIYTLAYNRPRRLLLYGWGLVVGSGLTYLFNPDELMVDDPWKFGIGYPVALAVMLFASRKECPPRISIILTATIGTISFMMGTRSIGGFCLAAAFYLLITRFLRRKGAVGAKVNTRSVLIVAASIILVAVGILGVYGYAAGAGILGEEARKKYEGQSKGQYGLLLGGRVEMLGYLPAIYDSPILGHGSWARDPSYLLAERQALAVMGYIEPGAVFDNEFEEGYIPTHSYIFGAWVDAGILGALFWGWVFVLTAKALMRVYPVSVSLVPLMSFAALGLLWDLVFSPYGAQMRIISPYYIVIMMTCLNMAPHKSARVVKGTAKKHIVTASL